MRTLLTPLTVADYVATSAATMRDQELTGQIAPGDGVLWREVATELERIAANPDLTIEDLTGWRDSYRLRAGREVQHDQPVPAYVHSTVAAHITRLLATAPAELHR